MRVLGNCTKLTQMQNLNDSSTICLPLMRFHLRSHFVGSDRNGMKVGSNSQIHNDGHVVLDGDRARDG